MIRIHTLSPALESQYRAFLLADQSSLIYASLEFRDFLAEAVGGEPTILLALDVDDLIVGALGYFRLEVPDVGTVINSLPWYGSHGGCVVWGRHAEHARQALLARYREAVEGPDVLSATIVLMPDEERARNEYLSILQPDALDRRIGQVTELPMVGDDLERRIMQKTRNLVRKSLRQAFVQTIEDDEAAWQFLYQTHAENMAGVGGKPKLWKHFEAMRNTIPASARRLYLAYLDGKPVAALLLFYFNRTVEYITPVIKHEHRSAQPLSFLIWHAMQDAISEGFQWWNWGGTWTSQKSLHHFKAGWGAENRPYTYLISSSQRGRSLLTANKHRLSELFPYYYTYPYDSL